MRIAVISDLHLTDSLNTVKWQVLEWLKSELRSQKPDLLMAIGDLTALGTEEQNRRMLSYINGLGIPCFLFSHHRSLFLRFCQKPEV